MKKDGTLTAIQGTWYVDTGYYSFTTQAQVAIGCGELMIMAQCPNWDLKNHVVVTNRNASGSMRGFGGQELKCAFIPLLSLAMEKAGLDPFEVLKKNMLNPEGGITGVTESSITSGALIFQRPWIRVQRRSAGRKNGKAG
jgi:xanthine dehydrogenase molybdenum-binding subunit